MLSGTVSGVVLSMDYQVLFNVAVMIVGALGGWVLGRITSDIKDISTQLTTLRSEHARTREDYVKRVDHDAVIGQIKSDFGHRFDRIDDKLERISERLPHPATPQP